VVLGVVGGAARRRSAPRPRGESGWSGWQPAACGVLAVAGPVMLFTWTIDGHAGSGDQRAVAAAADLVHLAAMAVWLGGLLLVVVGLLPRGDPGELAAVLPRFSRTAFSCVLLLVATGCYAAWREVGTLPALLATAYGRLLLLKLGGVAGLLVLGAAARGWVRRHYPAGRGMLTPTEVLHAHNDDSAGSDGDPAGRDEFRVNPERAVLAPPTAAAVTALRRGLVGELAVGAVVLALTSALTGTVQAREAYAPAYATTASTATLVVRVRVAPAHAGPALIHVDARTPAGRPASIQQVSGALSLPERDVGPLPLTFVKAGTGRAQAAARLPTAGRWVLQLAVQTSVLDASGFTVEVPVR
jgi:copper transport protein